jgi:hypothetical protein
MRYCTVFVTSALFKAGYLRYILRYSSVSIIASGIWYIVDHKCGGINMVEPLVRWQYMVQPLVWRSNMVEPLVRGQIYGRAGSAAASIW